MKKIFLLTAVFFYSVTQAQQFISNGLIEYEVRVDNYKVLGDSYGFLGQAIKDKMPNFSISWYDLTFSNDKGIYKFDRIDEKTKAPSFFGNSDHDNIWFSNYSNGTFTDQKDIYGDTYLLQDTLMNIKWKMVPNETREIAGFNCRKAQAIIFDSVYVFAFYTDEITVSGGPMGIHGLPGMIMGITIPRMFTSWIATKLELAGIDKNKIVEPQKGKKSKATELIQKVKKALSDYGSWAQQEIWKLFL